MKKLKFFLLICIILFSLINVQTPVIADGSVSSQDLWMEYIIENQEPWNSTGTYNDASNNLVDYIRLSYIRLDDGYDYYTVTGMGYYAEAAHTSALRFLVYVCSGVADAGALINQTEEWNNAAGAGWEDYDINDFNITSSDISNNGVYAGLWGDGVQFKIMDETVAQTYGAINHWVDAQYPSAEDPLADEVRSANDVYGIRLNYTAYKQTKTTHNQYYGSATDYIARYDANATFLSGSINREMSFTYPKTEYLLNITYLDGGEWNATLTTSQYTDEILNATHRLITISESTINATGSNYRLYTQYYPYQYTLYGPFWENGTYYQAMDVSAHMESDTEVFEVEGTTQIGFNESVVMFSFAVGSMNRMIYTSSDTSFYIFYPDDDYSLYEFDIDDYTGKIGEGTSYLESYRGINGTYRLIERVEILDVVNDVPLVLVTSQSYRLIIRFGDDSTYTFGFFVSGINPNPIISITEIEFGDQAHTVYQYILAETTRPNATHIRMNYQDDTPSYDTIIVNFTVTYRNGTLVYNSSQSGLQTLTFNWYGADNETDYVVELWARQQYHGQIRQKWILDYERSFLTFPDLDVLGTWPFPSQNIFPLMISVLIAALFSFGSMTLAPFMFMSVLSSFVYIGAASFTYTQLAIGFALSIIFALAYREGHG